MVMGFQVVQIKHKQCSCVGTQNQFLLCKKRGRAMKVPVCRLPSLQNPTVILNSNSLVF